MEEWDQYPIGELGLFPLVEFGQFLKVKLGLFPMVELGQCRVNWVNKWWIESMNGELGQ